MTAEDYPKFYLYRRIVQAKLFIDHNYANTIDVSNISDESYFSKFHFIRLFKKIYGHTPHQYLTSVRMDHAKELLKAGHTVSDACYAVGFESLSSFSGLFKRKVGITAAGFLMQQQQLKAEIIKTPLKFVPGCFISQNGWAEE